jgi:hypothetical protein
VVVVAVGGEEDDAQSRDGESLGCVREKGREDSEWRGQEVWGWRISWLCERKGKRGF